MDMVPTQDVAYGPHDELTGTWPCRTTKLLGYKTMDNTVDPPGWGPRLDLSTIGNGIEFSGGKSLEQMMPTQMRRDR